MITHDTPESVYTRKPVILYDREGYSEYEIIYCDGQEIPYHAFPAYGGVTLQEVQDIYTKRQNALKKALESDVLEYESIDHETFSRDLEGSSQGPYFSLLRLEWPKNMKFSEYLAHLIQGDTPADISLEELQNRIEKHKTSIVQQFLAEREEHLSEYECIFDTPVPADELLKPL